MPVGLELVKNEEASANRYERRISPDGAYERSDSVQMYRVAMFAAACSHIIERGLACRDMLD